MAPVGIINGNFRSGDYRQFSQDDMIRPTDAILQFIKKHADQDVYPVRFNEIYGLYRWSDYPRYVDELRKWRQELADAQAERDKRTTKEFMKIQTDMLRS
jgi:hypothetical protein